MKKRQIVNFNSSGEMVNWLVSNDSVQLVDSHGRVWSYGNGKFYFKDIGGNEFEESNQCLCLHLYDTKLYTFK